MGDHELLFEIFLRDQQSGKTWPTQKKEGQMEALPFLAADRLSCRTVGDVSLVQTHGGPAHVKWMQQSPTKPTCMPCLLTCLPVLLRKWADSGYSCASYQAKKGALPLTESPRSTLEQAGSRNARALEELRLSEVESRSPHGYRRRLRSDRAQGEIVSAVLRAAVHVHARTGVCVWRAGAVFLAPLGDS